MAMTRNMPREMYAELEESKRFVIGKHIVVREHDLPLPKPEDGHGNSEQGIALKLARQIFNTDDWPESGFINMSTGLGVSPQFHTLGRLAASGVLTMPDMAATS